MPGEEIHYHCENKNISFFPMILGHVLVNIGERELLSVVHSFGNNGTVYDGSGNK